MPDALAAVGEEEYRPRHWNWNRQFYEMIPNWALEKHAWLGAGLIWKRIHAGLQVKKDVPRNMGQVPRANSFRHAPFPNA